MTGGVMCCDSYVPLRPAQGKLVHIKILDGTPADIDKLAHWFESTGFGKFLIGQGYQWFVSGDNITAEITPDPRRVS